MARGCRELTARTDSDDATWTSSLSPSGVRPKAVAADSVVVTAAVPDPASDVAESVAWAHRVGSLVDGLDDSAVTAWETLAAVGEADVAAARVLEPHLDALTILREAGSIGASFSGAETWGVYAAEGPGVRLTATRSGAHWSLTGCKPWCSLAGHLSHALVTAWTSENERALFAVDLAAAGVAPHDGPWVARGLSSIVSAPVDFDRAHAVLVGEPGWYTDRPGFAWGGVGVAAVWWGATIPLLRALASAVRRPDSDQLSAAYLGGADAAWWAARTALSDAATRADAGDDPGLFAPRSRAIVVDAVERILTTTDRALGPAPLTTVEKHARRVNDLRIYVRQDHAERDLARLGRRIAR